MQIGFISLPSVLPKMRRLQKVLLMLPLSLACHIFPCTAQHTSGSITIRYTPDNQSLFDTVVKLDSLLFTAYNTCDLPTQAAFYSDSIEFYHDQGGLMTSKDTLMERLKKYICGKVTRTLVKGSIEVYPIHDYGALEMGLHRFSNNQEPGSPSQPNRFMILWQYHYGKWQIRRVISLH